MLIHFSGKNSLSFSHQPVHALTIPFQSPKPAPFSPSRHSEPFPSQSLPTRSALGDKNTEEIMVLSNFLVFYSLFWHSRHRFGVWNSQCNPGWGKGESQFGHAAGALWGFGTSSRPKRRGGHLFRAENSKWESPILSLMCILKAGTGREEIKLLLCDKRSKGWLSVLHPLPQKRSFQPNFDQFSARKGKNFVSFVWTSTLRASLWEGRHHSILFTTPSQYFCPSAFGTTPLQTKLIP